ncbi:Permease of the drug/metabolite transporter (DMT) superfamily [Candidatus Burkholderia pumila]|uniref:Permease of the drug/metabolite transporter (DMT) superfamily n=1 Tax=Candidatus Burkholderia pumila TaxID=1090375 RepID=A0ABR5HNB7_9BURK|nr:Permease of the drug/metabolite transporter (DMT) superfamily [Candidatus Burkholderia pumila]
MSLGVIISFPVFSAWAMKTVLTSHGAVVNGLQPLCVAYLRGIAERDCRQRDRRRVRVAGGRQISSGRFIDARRGRHRRVGLCGRRAARVSDRRMAGPIYWALVLSAPFLLLPIGWLAGLIMPRIPRRSR